MHRSKIEWVLNPDNKTLGWVWNPITGCLNHINGLCNGGGFPCYAYKLANGRLKSRYLANLHLAPVGDPNSFQQSNDALNDPFYPRFWVHRLAEPIEHPRQSNLPKQRGILVCNMSDLFGIGIPEEWTQQIIYRIKLCPYHRFYLLTKQPQNLIKWSPFPQNCYVGVTATDTDMAEKALYYLRQVEARIKYISFEPLLEEIVLDLSGIQQGIIGQQTKPDYPPIPSWVYGLIDCLDRAGAKVFIKDNLGWPRITADGSAPFYKKDQTGTWILRQEIPERG